MSATLSSLAWAATGSQAAGVTGALGAVLSSLAVSGAGTSSVTGSSAVTLSSLATASSGTALLGISGSLAAALSSLAPSGTGGSTVTGSASAALRSLAVDESGTVTLTGSASAAFRSLATGSSGSVTYLGPLSAGLSSLAATASGSVTQLSITGTLSATLSLVLNSSGFVGIIAVGGGSTREILIPTAANLTRSVLDLETMREILNPTTTKEIV
jgi:hypothetical protein